MQGRHARMLMLFLSLSFWITAMLIYFFVAIHYKHIWSLFCNAFLLFVTVATPAICFGFRTDDPVFIVQHLNISEEDYLNRRDCGYMTGSVFFILTYLMPVVAWYSSSGVSLPFVGVLLVFVANTMFAIGFMGWVRIMFL